MTLTGTGGVGKTRLALQVAADVLDEFADGVTFVSLAPISDPDLVMLTNAGVLDVKERGAPSLLDLLKAFLNDKHLLLVLDNFEQILPAAPRLTDLLTSCSELKMLVTSRAALHVQGEHEFPVPPLAVPDLKHLPPMDAMSHYAVLPHTVVDNSAISPTGLTVPSDSAYDEETFHATHFKQRGSLWPFICSCSCSWSASSLWCCFGVFAGSIFRLPPHKQGADARRCTVCSSPAPRLIVPSVVSPCQA